MYLHVRYITLVCVFSRLFQRTLEVMLAGPSQLKISTTKDLSPVPGFRGKSATATEDRLSRTCSLDPFNGPSSPKQEGDSPSALRPDSSHHLHNHKSTLSSTDRQSTNDGNWAYRSMSTQDYGGDGRKVRALPSRRYGKQTDQDGSQEASYIGMKSESTIAEGPPATKSDRMSDPQSIVLSKARVRSTPPGPAQDDFIVQHDNNDRNSIGRAMEDDVIDTITIVPYASSAMEDIGRGDKQVVRSSGRQRRPTRKHVLESEAVMLCKATTSKVRNLNSAADTAAQDQLAPTQNTGRKRGRPPKSVKALISEAKRAGEDLDFQDLPTQSLSEERLAEKVKPINAAAVPSVGIDAKIPRKRRGRPAITAVKQARTEGSLIADMKQNSDILLEQLQRVLLEEQSVDSLAVLRMQILNRLTGASRLPLIGLDDEYHKVYQLVGRTVLAGEGNSMLIIGARGCAKTTLVETMVSEMATHHRDDFHVIRLNGFIHTDDKLALKEIWRQLGREMEVEEDPLGAKSNYEDTLSSLLALLSHTGEAADIAEKPEAQTVKSVIFIMDEFDLFAAHPRQTLLYNLFDIAQSRKAPVAVLGLTTKIDVVESLEKRVKSRFSHRYVHLSLPRSFHAFQTICLAALCCKLPDDLDSIPPMQSNDLKYTRLVDNARLVDAWSSYVTTLLKEDPVMNSLLRRIYTHQKSVPAFLNASLIPILSLTIRTLPKAVDFVSNALLPPDSKLHLLSDLSELELSLLISAARLDIILDTDTCNFNMAYDEYTILTDRAKLQSSSSGAAAFGAGARLWGRDIALGCWERLEELRLLIPVIGLGRGNRTAGSERAGKLVKVDVALEELGASGAGMSSLMARWCREI